MKIVWICNVELPVVSELRNVKVNPIGGWLDEVSRKILENGHELLILYRSSVETSGTNNNLKYMGFINAAYVEKALISFLPDIVHIWGTEYIHSLQITKICQKHNLINRTVISIQGLVFIYGKYHFYANLPLKIIYGFSLRDLLRLDNVYYERKQFLKRGEYEKECISNITNVIGRTVWDKTCVKQINNNINYFNCNETLRKTFYQEQWDIKHCDKYTIFFSQCHYPIKGFHMALEAFRILKKKYSNIKIFTVGVDIFSIPFYKRTYYQKYLMNLIIKYDLKKNIIFCGQLSAQEMKKRYLKCNVFISSSSIENSSNSIGEAMLVGCPIVASYVGGIRNLLNDEDGYIYPFDEPYMLAQYIDNIFSSDNLAIKFSNNSRKHAQITHDPEKNYYRLFEIYNQISK